MSRVRRALISVSDKTGIVELAKELVQQEVQIISTGGTFQLLQQEGLPVTQISEVTGFPEILDGRVKTLHPKVHGGLLAVRDKASHQQACAENGIEYIDLVVVNLYPFKATITKEGFTYEEAIENIDIGGPSMLRSAAKNHQDVTVLVDPADYHVVLEELSENGNTTLATRKRLAAKTFRHTAAYDSLIAHYLTGEMGETSPEQLTFTYEKVSSLRYGENPHQQASYYKDALAKSDQLVSAKQLQGKELSYNNIQDANAALEIVKEFAEPAVVAVKHMNPCGVAVGETLLEAYQRTYEADPVSIFGGIIATNQTVDAVTASKMREIFLEIIIAPSFSEEAQQILSEKKNLRLLELPFSSNESISTWKTTSIDGGILVQEQDSEKITREMCTVATDRNPTDAEWDELLFAWKVVKHVKSNAIVLTKDNRTIGVGAGQMNRVGAAEIAIRQAADNANGAVLASDAFFPMSDTLEKAAAAGIRAIIQPGGSIRDSESIEAANKHGIAMVFTGVRHFKH
ncbi:bifunctional phosphoribosylaminoimidazolecarboxamide formyltransferase/IMP cyclohydrolase [Shimazuella kribbensis]|uniref:bifunctional phosphoribosylaminoimidazolecarboxamide formyltransferase/IMP cyclohydrolase n=1 Tax=Shimazuella kribbensis TaxID=139808 RepID=UPI0004045B1C|nr:bifunctional phosphoribosylaminoimidazolecarboxamide formyltransferase/IMP cyclohydrolase [Shimazuella kribbensis]